MSNQAILVGSIDDFYLLRDKYSDMDFYATNYYVFLSLKNHGVKYLYSETHESAEDYDSITQIVLNWYKDKAGKDIFSKNGISFAPLITRSLLASFANDYRNFNALLPLSEKYESIHISINSEQSFKNVAEVFDNNIKFFNSDSKASLYFTSSPIRTVIGEYPNWKRASFMGRILQLPFLLFIKNKILVWSDWTYKDIFKNRHDHLYLNALKPWKGFYLLKDKRHEKDAKIYFPDSFSEGLLTKESLLSLLDYKKTYWDEKLIALFINSVNRIYFGSYINLRKCYTTLVSSISLYRPTSIVLPGQTSFIHLLILQIAKLMKIKMFLAVDGFPMVLDKGINTSDESAEELLFTKYIAYGSAGRDYYVEKMGLPKEKVIISESPIVSKLLKSKKALKDKNIGAVIMSYYPNQHNPQSKWDMRYKIAADIIELLQELEETSINLKIKDGLGSSIEESTYKEYFELVGIDPSSINIIRGESHTAIACASYIIGQASSSCFEAAIIDKDYFIYEPFENGVTREMLNSTIADIKEAPRTIEQLRTAIIESKPVIFRKNKYLTDGETLDQISFT